MPHENVSVRRFRAAQREWVRAVLPQVSPWWVHAMDRAMVEHEVPEPEIACRQARLESAALAVIERLVCDEGGTNAERLGRIREVLRATGRAVEGA